MRAGAAFAVAKRLQHPLLAFAAAVGASAMVASVSLSHASSQAARYLLVESDADVDARKESDCYVYNAHD